MDNHLNLFEFSNYREYLKSWLAVAREQKTSNLSRLAELLSVHTTFLSHVLSGVKELSPEHAIVLSRELKLTKIEREYFLSLVNIERSGSAELKEYWREKKKAILLEKNRLSSRVGDHQELTDQQRALFYSSWLYVAVFAATSIDDGQTISQIASRFHISRDHAEQILDFLLQAGVCEKRSELFVPGKTMIYVPNVSPFVLKHHMNWRMRAMQKMDTREDRELYFSFPMSIAKNDFDLVREKLANLIKEITEICRASNPEEVACLNIDFFGVKS